MNFFKSVCRAAVAAGSVLAGLATGAGPAVANCLPIASAPPLYRPAAFIRAAAPAPHTLRFTYYGHSSFLIETVAGVRALTDYNGVNRPEQPPHIVTMNNSHDSHYTDFVDPRIEHVLRGWDAASGIAQHDLKVKDLRVRNVPTNFTEWGGRLAAGNSLFVFEAARLCIVHLGHLHHVLTPKQMTALGRIHVVLAPIDGGMTLGLEELFKVLEQISPRLIIPMHFGFGGALEAFVAQAQSRYPVKHHDGPALDLSVGDLPRRTTVLFLGGP